MNSYQLSSVSIDNFMSLRDVSVDLGDLNLLIGPNGAGKSNFLSLFDMMGALSDQRLGHWVASQGGAQRVLFGGTKTSSSVRVELNFEDTQGYNCELSFAIGGGLFFSFEQAWFKGDAYTEPFDERLGSGHTESRLAEVAQKEPGKVVDHTLRCLRGVQRYHFHDTSDTALLKEAHPVDDNGGLKRDGRNLAPFLMALQKSAPEAFTRIEDALRAVAPFFERFLLKPSPHDPNSVKLEWRHQNSDLYADAATLSDGSLRFLCLATVLLQPNPPRIILLDEPELGLHPSAIYHIAELMRLASLRSQLIVATQSVTLLDQLGIQDTIVVDRVAGASALSRPDIESLAKWLESYSLGELWEKNLIGGRPSGQ